MAAPHPEYWVEQLANEQLGDGQAEIGARLSPWDLAAAPGALTQWGQLRQLPIDVM